MAKGRIIGKVIKYDGRQPTEEEAHEIIHHMQAQHEQVNETEARNIEDFILSDDQVQKKRPVKYMCDDKLSPETKNKLDKIIQNYGDIFSKSQYDVGISKHPPVEIPTEGPPCISAPYTIPLKFRPWSDNTINKLLQAGMIQ